MFRRLFHLEPVESDAVLWRYMSLARLEQMLREGIFFARADLLGDRFEGSVPRTSKDLRDLILRSQGLGSQVEPRAIFRQQFVERVAISCWHQNDGESMAMWKIYGRLLDAQSEVAVAVTTTAGLLHDVLEQVDEEIDALGRVQYVDFDREYPDEYDALAPFFWKRKSYMFENEVRAVIARPEGAYPEGIGKGITVPIEPARYIVAVHVSPELGNGRDHDDGTLDRVQAVVRRFAPTVEVRRSSEDSAVLF